LLILGTFPSSILSQEASLLATKDQLPKLDSFLNLIEKLNKEDTSYLKTLGDLVKYLRQRDTDLAIHYAEMLIHQSEVVGNTRITAEAKNILGVCHSMQGNYLKAVDLMQESSAIAEKHNFATVLAAAKMNLGIVHKSMNDFPKSIEYYHEAWEIYNDNQITSPLPRISNNLGNLYTKMGDMEKSLYYLRDAKEKYAEIDNSKGFAAAQLNMGIWYLKNDDLSRAKEILDSVLTYVVSNNLVAEEILVLAALGEVFVKENNVEKASHYLNSAIEMGRQYHRPDVVFTCLSRFAILWADQGDLNRSLRYIEEAEETADLLKSSSISRDLSYDKYKIFEQFGDWKNALSSYEGFIYWRDSIQNEEQVSKFRSHQIHFEIAQKNKALETQELELALLKSKLLLRTRGQWVLGFISLLLLTIGFLYFKKFRERKAFASKLHEKNYLITRQKKEIDQKNDALEEQYQLRTKIDDTIYSFASSLSSKNNVEEVVEDMIEKCISQFGFLEGSIYMLDAKREYLVEKSSFNAMKISEKNDPKMPISKGLAGRVAQTGKPEISSLNQSTDILLSQEANHSEIAVPLIHQGKVIGVLHSLHPDRDFFTSYHLDVLRTVSSLCASKITQVLANEESQKAKLVHLEGVKAKELNEMKSRFFANVSHEFRTPLHLILAPLEQLKKNGISRDELEMMRRNAKRLLRLVNQLLDLTKIEHQQLQSEKKNIELFGFVSEIAKSFLPLAQQKNIQYQIDIPERDYVSLCDPDHLEKVIYNLLSNAFKFTPEGKQISIHLHHEKHESIKLTISDTGIGIPKEQIQHIFDRFYQVEGTEQGAFIGTGIGLSLIKELVDLMGGDIQVDSQIEKGSIFTIFLPLNAIDGDLPVEEISPEYSYQQDTANNSAFEPKETSSDNNAPLILLVEDHAEMRSYVKQQLSANYRVLEAQDGDVGFDLALQHIPDVIITDLMMPKKNGLELLKDIRKSTQTSHIPVVLLTAKDDSLTRTSSFMSGAEQFLGKPFEMVELMARIKGLLHQREILSKKFQKLNLLANRGAEVDDRDHQFLQKLVIIIEQNLDNEVFSVQSLQKEIGMSRMQLHRKLKALVNHSTSEFIRKVRLHHAAQYLSQPGYQVAEVAYKVGFTHLSYFAKCFKDQYGKSPSEYGLN